MSPDRVNEDKASISALCVIFKLKRSSITPEQVNRGMKIARDWFHILFSFIMPIICTSSLMLIEIYIKIAYAEFVGIPCIVTSFDIKLRCITFA